MAGFDCGPRQYNKKVDSKTVFNSIINEIRGGTPKITGIIFF